MVSRTAQYGRSDGATRIQTRDLDIGLDYDRPISFSRRTTFSFSTGSSLTPEGGRTHYRVTGHAVLNHEIARTWTASLLYSRALQFVEAFPQPYFSDSISARVGGNASRRVDLAFSGAYAVGEMSGAAGGGTLGTYTGTGGLTIAVNRHVALAADYLYYHYRLGQQTVSAVIPNRLDRQTIRIGLKLWFPVD
jgi:opacity protein-like surface antigen